LKGVQELELGRERARWQIRKQLLGTHWGAGQPLTCLGPRDVFRSSWLTPQEDFS